MEKVLPGGPRQPVNTCVFSCSGDRRPVGSRLCLLQAETPDATGPVSAAVLLQQALPSGAGTHTHSKVMWPLKHT